MSRTGQFALLGERRFGPFFWTQFSGAANDNVFKSSFMLLVTYSSPALTSLDVSTAVNMIAAVFILPFLLFSATSGQVSDKIDKARLMRAVKLFEVAIMLAGAWGFYAHSFPVLLACIFLMGMHSTLFGPAKYAYLPQHLGAEEIVGGNGMVEMGTFVAILLGTLAGGVLIGSGEDGPLYAAATCLALALLGLLASAGIPRTPPADPDLELDLNPVRVTWRNLRLARAEPTVFVSLLGISWLWFYGVLFLTQFPPFARDVLGGGPGVANLLLAMFTCGTAVGALGCDRLSRHRIELGLVPLGVLGMTLFGIDLYFAIPPAPADRLQTVAQFLSHARHWRVLADLFLLSICAGIYSVPLYALIQTRCPETHRARIIAANNILNALFMILASGFAIGVLVLLGATIAQLFLAAALLNAAVGAFLCVRMPEFPQRFVVWLRR
ncbi:MAG TPA: MFS transporter [Burkholderiaceae bacterium]